MNKEIKFSPYLSLLVWWWLDYNDYNECCNCAVIYANVQSLANVRDVFSVERELRIFRRAWNAIYPRRAGILKEIP